MEVKIIYDNLEVSDNELTSTSSYSQEILEKSETKRISYSTYDLSNKPD
jgi:hypothetical protein